MSVIQSVTQPNSFSTPGFQSFVGNLNEPAWLKTNRHRAWDLFQELKWPDRTQEEWMRSDLRGFKLEKYRLPMPGSELAAGQVPQRLSAGVELAGQLETLDGSVVAERLKDRWLRAGVLFGDLSRLAVEQPDLVRKHLFSVVDANQDRFAALHAATWSGGQFLFVPRGVCIEEPVHVVAGMTDGGIDTGHTLIVLDEGSEATFLYEASSNSLTAGGLHCGSVEIVLLPGARLRYINLQDWGKAAWHFAHHRATVDRDASLQWTIATLGSRFSQVSQSVSLVGEGAYSQVNGVMFTQDRQQLTYNTLQHHEAPHCRSDFLYKSALQDQSRTVWRGMIRVDRGAIKTDGYQRNDNLLLSDQARADSIPGLEILADDVRCTHGSTSGKVDEEQIFYARSRGFTRREAVRMIVTGFFQQIFDRIAIESVRDALGQAIARQVREYN